MASFRLTGRNLQCVIGLLLVGLGCGEGPEISEAREDFLGSLPMGDTARLLAPGLISTGAHELDITMTPDSKEVFFTRAGPDWTSMILTLRRDGRGWVGPSTASFTRGVGSLYPFVAPSGDKVFFDFSEPLTVSDQHRENNNLYVSYRSGDGWTSGQPLDSIINTENTEMFAGVALNGNLYFAADYRSSEGGFDIYRSVMNEDVNQAPENLGTAVNSEGNEFHAFISPDETFLLFDSDRAGGFGENDLYVSFRDADGNWLPAVNLGARVNTAASESRPYVSPDGKSLFFCSNRTASDSPAVGDVLTYTDFMKRIDGPGNGNQDIYWMDAGFIGLIRSEEGSSPG